jgi:energy-converting hydrogenase Eha subunit A
MNKKIGKIIDLVFKAVALAMGVAVVVTNIMGVMDTKGQVLLLGIGLFSLAITALDKE